MKNAYAKIEEKKNDNGLISEIAGKNNDIMPLPRKNDFFQIIAENVSDIILHADLTTKFHYDYVSPSCTHITGYTPEEFTLTPSCRKK